MILFLYRHSDQKADDLKEFHNVVIGQGGMPLGVLQAEVESYIERKLLD